MTLTVFPVPGELPVAPAELPSTTPRVLEPVGGTVPPVNVPAEASSVPPIVVWSAESAWESLLAFRPQTTMTFPVGRATACAGGHADPISGALFATTASRTCHA